MVHRNVYIVGFFFGRKFMYKVINENIGFQTHAFGQFMTSSLILDKRLFFPMLVHIFLVEI